MKLTFPCIACGECCRCSGSIPQLQALINKKGICRYFDETTQLCRVYSHRPEICNVDKVYETYFRNAMSEREFIVMNLEACYQLNYKAANIGNMNTIKELIEKFPK